jgi:hypothetical protein
MPSRNLEGGSHEKRRIRQPADTVVPANQHPEEHRHTLAEVPGWFAENGVEYFRAYPSAVLGEEPEALLVRAVDNWRLESWLAQLGWMRALGHEGGVFFTVGHRL